MNPPYSLESAMRYYIARLLFATTFQCDIYWLDYGFPGVFLGDFISIISLPEYVPQVGQAWCGSLGVWHCGQSTNLGNVKAR
jgi:hypothetical protein